MIPFLLGQLKSRLQEKKGDLLAKKISMIPTRSVAPRSPSNGTNCREPKLPKAPIESFYLNRAIIFLIAIARTFVARATNK